MASSQICGPCKRMDKSASAVKYCIDCEDPLCTDCVTIHKAIKALVLHHLVDKEVQADKAFSIKRTCSDHPDMGLEFYCSNHESLCCRICSVNTHRACGKILPIDVAARGIKTSVMFNDVTADLKALLKTAEQLEENRTRNKENIGKAKVTTLQEIAQFKRELIQELNELENKLMTDVDMTEKKLTRKAESDLSDIETRKKVIANLSVQLEFLTKHGSESQILMLLNTIRVDISKQENDFQNLVPSYECALAGAAWGIAIIPGTNEAVVTLPSIDSIQFVNITSMFPGKVMEVPDKPYGVTIVKNMIVFGGAEKVYFLTMTGSLMETFNVGSGKLYSLKTGEMDMSYCCEADKDTLHCIDINGTVIFSYASPDVIGPADIALDGKENIYVTICTSNKLHRLSADGKLLDILLKAEDGLNESCRIAFNKNNTKLYALLVPLDPLLCTDLQNLSYPLVATTTDDSRVYMASSQMCGPCTRMDKSATAVKFCTDCEDPLCAYCVTTHKAIKALALHHLIDAAVQTDKAFNIRRTCSDHPDMVLEFYCSNHESLCCRTCSVNTHRTCGKILPIDVAAREIKSSVMLNDVTADLKNLLNTADQLVEDRAKNKENIEKTKATTLQNIVKFKRQLIQELDELEKKLMTEVDETETKLTKKAESDLSDIEIRRKAIVDMSEQLAFLTKHGSESQILMLLNTIRVDISKQENDFQNLVPSYECIDVNFKASRIKSALNSLGSVEIKSAPCSIAHKPSKHTQAQIPPEHGKMPTKFKLKNEFKVPYSNGRISSIVVTNDNKLLLCYSGNQSKALSIWSDTGNHIQDCALTGIAWGIAIIPGTNEAVVTLPSINSVQFVNITSMIPGRVMKVPDLPFGVTIVKNMIVLGGTGKIYFLSMTGTVMKRFNVGSDCLYSLKVNKTDKIYCCDAYCSALHCIDINGTVIFSYRSPDFNGPVDMALDDKENLYVTTWGTNKLNRLSKDCKLLDILLKKKDGLNEPYAVAFNKNYTKLYIANGRKTENKAVLIFDCA
ncbi:unnamed protein product [Mytilus coruscus]|uniref:B box-type domain-containing protein n=1 Tax=Mytilus coruscus TaxID=42192 RepID=A0A6J8B2X7_MYTCO|nr:unnamed protein product [Mytilus coruscus]